MFWIISIIISIAIAVLTPKPKIQTPPAAVLGDLQLPSATEDRALPVVFGTCKLFPSVTWFGDFKSEAATHDESTGLFSSTTVTDGYRYYVGIEFAICHEPIDELIAIYSDKRIVWSDGLTPARNSVNVFTVSQTWTMPSELISEGVQAICELIAQAPIGDPSSIVSGTPAATVMSPYMTSVIGSAGLPAHRGVTRVIWRGPSATPAATLDTSNPFYNFFASQLPLQSGWIGNSVTPAPIAFVVKRLPNISALGPQYFAQVASRTVGISEVESDSTLAAAVSSTVDLNGDANPAWVLYEVLTNTSWGAGIWPGFISAPSFIAAAQTLADEDNGLSMAWQESQPVSTIADIVCRQANGVLVRNPVSGLFEFRLIREGDAVAANFDDSTISTLVQFGRLSLDEAVNQIRVTFTDRENGYQQRVVMASNPALFDVAGAILSDDSQYEGCSRSSVAAQLALRDIQTVAQPLALITLETSVPDGTVLRPGDVVNVSWSPLGMVNMRCRITAATYETSLTSVQLELTQDVFSAASGFYASASTPVYVPGTPPVAIASQKLFLAPYALKNSDSSYVMQIALPPANLSTDGYQLRWSDSGQPSVLRVSGNLTHGLAATGTINTALTSATSATALALTVDGYSAAVLATSKAGYAIIGDPEATGYQEWVSFTSVSVSGDIATLQGLTRGIFDTFPIAAPTATPVYVLYDYGLDNRPMQATLGTAISEPGYASVTTYALATGKAGVAPLASVNGHTLTAGGCRAQLARYPAAVKFQGVYGSDSTVGADAAITASYSGSPSVPHFTLTHLPRSRTAKLPAVGGWFDTTQTPTPDSDCQLQVTITPIDPTTGTAYPAVLSATYPMSTSTITFALPGGYDTSSHWRIPDGTSGPGALAPLIFKITLDAQRTFSDGTVLGTGGAWVKYFSWNGS